MTSISLRRGFVAASLVLSTLMTAGAASAADLAYKAPTPPPAPLDIHGFFDVSFNTDYISPRGLHVNDKGLTTQIATGLLVDLYKNNNGYINKFTVYAGIWNDLWSEQKSPTVGSWNEFDWWFGAQIGFAKNWTFDAQYIEFLSPPGNFSTERNLSLTLSYDDTSWGLPIAIKPYVRGWYELSGPSVVATGKSGNGYVEFGANPTLDLKKQWGVYFVAPTYVTVGSKEFWAGPTTTCGTVTSPCAASNGGVFSTGLTAFVPVTWIPKNYGNWTVRGGFQYYHLINDYLLQAQVATGVASNYSDAKRDIAVGFVGLGFNF